LKCHAIQKVLADPKGSLPYNFYPGCTNTWEQWKREAVITMLFLLSHRRKLDANGPEEQPDRW